MSETAKNIAKKISTLPRDGNLSITDRGVTHTVPVADLKALARAYLSGERGSSIRQMQLREERERIERESPKI